MSSVSSAASVPLRLEEMVTMRDGVRLATDIYLPAEHGCWPVVIERTPYGKRKASRSEMLKNGAQISREEMALAFSQRGYVLIFQDCRGRYDSEGVFVKYTGEGADGFDTLQWILRQPWCNGKIGSMGLSYAAHTQLAMACLNPPGLKTMVLDSGGFSNAWQCGIRQGGAFELKQATWAFKQAKESPQAKANPQIRTALEAEDILDWFANMPWAPGRSPLRHLPEYEEYLFEQWSHGDFDDYWKRNGLWAAGSYATLPDIPVLMMSSWYDNYVSSTLENYRAFCQKSGARHSLIMGPWLHGDRNLTYSGDADFGPGATFNGNVASNWLDYRLEWFDRQLCGQQQHQPPPAVAVFMMGGGSGEKTQSGRLDHGGEWLFAERWPLSGTRQKEFWLADNGTLSASPPTRNSVVSYLADPNHPVPTIGGSLTSGLPVYRGGAFDQRENAGIFGATGDGRPLSARPDVLVFQSDILSADLCVAGEVSVTLWVSSDAPDTDFTAKLIDVYPPGEAYPEGYEMNITDGILRCRYRNGGDAAADIEAGDRLEILIRPFATCNRFRAGHRLRVDIASSNFPHFDCNPNNGLPAHLPGEKRIARNSIWLGPETPSRLTLSILPEE